MTEFRTERDTMGEVKVPKDALYGAQTQRAVENFPISGVRFGRRFLRALGLIKGAAAETNMELGLLDPELGRPIAQAAKEVADGRFDDHFPLDIFQTGSGTSTNMNANEVIANRANQILGHDLGTKGPVHPNDHVNMGQSSNDVIPTAIHVAALVAIEKDLLPAMRKLHGALADKARAFDDFVKTGRTHLMDATPIRLGQEFGGFASQIEHGIRRIEAVRPHIAELALGGTAVGTGLNAHPEFAKGTIARISRETGVDFREAANHFEAQHAQDAVVEASGALRTVALSLFKVADDVRFFGSGPRAGLGELKLPELQPGSSIMPGKVNPVIPEAVIQVAAQVLGNDAAIAASGLASHFDLCTMMPVMAHNLLQSIDLLTNACHVFVDKCIAGLEANEARLRQFAELSTAIVTKLNPLIGYEKAAEVAKEAFRTGKTVKEVVVERGILSEEDADKLLDPRALTEPATKG
jgi:fumarate hydratase class II